MGRKSSFYDMMQRLQIRVGAVEQLACGKSARQGIVLSDEDDLNSSQIFTEFRNSQLTRGRATTVESLIGKKIPTIQRIGCDSNPTDSVVLVFSPAVFKMDEVIFSADHDKEEDLNFWSWWKNPYWLAYFACRCAASDLFYYFGWESLGSCYSRAFGLPTARSDWWKDTSWGQACWCDEKCKNSKTMGRRGDGIFARNESHHGHISSNKKDCDENALLFCMSSSQF